MSEHVWVQEHLAVHALGGLDPAEAERLERHAAECSECRTALAETRGLDHRLEGLFVKDRPGASLEDRLVRALRAVPVRSQRPRRWLPVTAALAASVVALALAGAGLSSLLTMGKMLPPSETTLTEAGAIMDASHSMAFANADGTTYYGLSIKADNFGDVKAREKEGDGAPVYRRKSSLGTPVAPEGRQLAQESQPADQRGKEENFRLPQGLQEHDKLAARTHSFFLLETLRQPTLARPSVPAVPDEGKDRSQRLSRLAQGDTTSPVSPPVETRGESTTLALLSRIAQEKPEPPAPQRKVIRTGEIEFEVDTFDSAAATVTRLVANIKGGFVATVNSDKLPNGKVRGSLVVRVPPETLDSLVLDLRKEIGKIGELKGLKVGSQDITKQYTDLESRLKAARTMETRLLEIIKSGKGEIKALLEAEKELGNWRTKIEEIEGELRYYANQVGLSTLTITLTEKSITTAPGLVESERVQAGVEVEDVETTQREALKAVYEAKGRVTRSEIKQHAAGQLTAQMHFEVPPDASGPLRDRLRQLGNVVRLEVDRTQRVDGTGTPPRDGKVTRGDAVFQVSFYNLANVAPRETTTMRMAVVHVPTSLRTLREMVTKARGRVLNAHVNEQDRQNVTAQLDFDVRRTEEASVITALGEAGEVLSRNITRAPEGENVTDAKVLYRLTLVAVTAIPPRETLSLGLEVADVDQTLAVFTALVKEADGRVITSQVGTDANGRITATMTYDVPLASAATLMERMKGAGQVRVQQSTRNPAAPEGKLALARLDVRISTDLLVPKGEGLLEQVRSGLSLSLRGLSISASWLVVAVLFLLPWTLLLGGVVWVLRRLFRTAPVQQPASPPPTPTA